MIIAWHRLGEDKAGSYAVAAAAEDVVWVATGVDLQLLPEATRRAAEGQITRPVLFRALAALEPWPTPALLIFALVPDLLLRTGLRPQTPLDARTPCCSRRRDVLLAVSYLPCRYLFGAAPSSASCGRNDGHGGRRDRGALPDQHLPDGFAATVLATQLVVAVAVFSVAMRRRVPARPPKRPRTLRDDITRPGRVAAGGCAGRRRYPAAPMRLSPAPVSASGARRPRLLRRGLQRRSRHIALVVTAAALLLTAFLARRRSRRGGRRASCSRRSGCSAA